MPGLDRETLHRKFSPLWNLPLDSWEERILSFVQAEHEEQIELLKLVAIPYPQRKKSIFPPVASEAIHRFYTELPRKLGKLHRSSTHAGPMSLILDEISTLGTSINSLVMTSKTRSRVSSFSATPQMGKWLEEQDKLSEWQNTIRFQCSTSATWTSTASTLAYLVCWKTPDSLSLVRFKANNVN